MKNEEREAQMKHDALVDAINYSDKALDSLTEAMTALSNAIINATNYWGGDEIMTLRKVHNKLNPLYRELKNAVNDLEKEVKGYVIKNR